MPRVKADPADPPAGKPGQPLDLSGLDGLLGYQVRRAHSAIYHDFHAALRPFDITQKQYAVLALLRANPGRSQIAIAGALGTDRATMMAIVDRLQDRHLLVRERSTTDRRRQELYLTEEGLALFEDANRLIARHEGRFLKRFSPQEVRQLMGMLRRIHEDTPAE